MKEKIKGMLFGTIIGDTIGTPFDGLSRGHIGSTFKKIDGFLDPAPALKNRIYRWKKPGLYSSLSQFMILLSLIFSRKKTLNKSKFIDFIQECKDLGETAEHIFRYTGTMEKSFIERTRFSDRFMNMPVYSVPSARVAPIIVPPILINSNSKKEFIHSVVSFCNLFNRNIFALSGSLVLGVILRKLFIKHNNDINIISIAVDEIDILYNDIKKISPSIFDLQVNPDTLQEAIEKFSVIMRIIKKINNSNNTEEMIYKEANRFLKTPVKRATVSHPICIIPYALHLSQMGMTDPANLFFSSVKEGGSTSILCSISGLIMGSIFGADWIPDNLIQELVNRKRIVSIINSISHRKATNEIIDNFIFSEAALTKKESEELHAKTKHLKTKKPKRSRTDMERELSAHVVESWTKKDQAQWKKEKKKRAKKKDKN